MTPLVKALLAAALVVPLVAYVAGSLASLSGGTPEQQGTVFIGDVEPASEDIKPSTKPSPQPSSTPSPARPSLTGDNRPTEAPSTDPDDEEARVVTPAPVGDDERDDDPDDDRDDTDDGDDTDGGGDD